jgi:NADH-quinone oxidoreductase subunit A
MLDAHLPLILTIVAAIGLGAVILVANALVGPRRRTAVKDEAFECGNPSSGTARDRFAVKFYMVAILFLVFDIEAVFIYPWAVVFSDATKGVGSLSPLVIVLDMVVFVSIIMVGLAYAWRKGALEWGPTARKSIDEKPVTP